MLYQQGRTITRDHNVSIRNNVQLLLLKEYYQKRFGWINTVYGKIDLEIFTPVHKWEKNKHFNLINKLCMRKLPVEKGMHERESKQDE